ncbi:IS110 family transposase [Caloranaerobacter azorensis]|nr:IS110 family transposase [Caloranaerobacter azorensis]QIB27761.1 IS110 family transposase [Caloranaerobacter azorensis]QIB27852.1 IS110 family transposase [Caloranaerobacter azorensis]
MENKIIVGIDVAKEFSYYSIITPNGKQYGKPFKAHNTLEGLEKVSKKLKEVEKELNVPCVLVMESTGHYSSILFHFFHNSNFEVCIVNPIQTNSIKNIKVRKVKNDKVDAYRIAILYKLGEIKPTKPPKKEIHQLNILCRQYIKLVDDCTMYKNNLISLIDQVYPEYNTAFSNITSKASLYILENYPSAEKLLNADKDTLITILATLSRKSLKWAKTKYNALIDVAKSALKIGCAPKSSEIVIKSAITILKTLIKQKSMIEKEIKAIAKNIEEIKLLTTIPGIGIISAAIFISEIRDFNNFKNARKLVAFCGIDPAVVESGKFKGNKVKMSKRGSGYLRRVLFMIALASIRKNRNSQYVNPILYNYYSIKIKSKPKKVALVAIMHKIVNYIFAVLRDKKPFRIITPEEHNKSYRQSKLKLTLVS